MKSKQRIVLTEAQINLKLPSKLKERIERYAASKDMNVSVAIRMILDERIREEDKSVR